MAPSPLSLVRPAACRQASSICRGENRNLAASSSTVRPSPSSASPRESLKQGDALLLRGVGHLQLHRQAAQAGPDGQLGQEKQLLMGGLLVQDSLEQLLLRRGAASPRRPSAPCGTRTGRAPVSRATSTPSWASSSGRSPSRETNTQRCFSPRHQVLHLKALARARPPCEADDPLPRLPEQQIQAAGCLLGRSPGGRRGPPPPRQRSAVRAWGPPSRC